MSWALGCTVRRTRPPTTSSSSGQCRQAAGLTAATARPVSSASRWIAHCACRLVRIRNGQASSSSGLDDVARRVRDEDVGEAVPVAQPRQQPGQLVHQAVDHPDLAPRRLHHQPDAAGPSRAGSRPASSATPAGRARDRRRAGSSAPAAPPAATPPCRRVRRRGRLGTSCSVRSARQAATCASRPAGARRRAHVARVVGELGGEREAACRSPSPGRRRAGRCPRGWP